MIIPDEFFILVDRVVFFEAENKDRGINCEKHGRLSNKTRRLLQTKNLNQGHLKNIDNTESILDDGGHEEGGGDQGGRHEDEKQRSASHHHVGSLSLIRVGSEENHHWFVITMKDIS